ncbi:hypothetical protein AG1IA_07778 [Rhizoctonia solani AG-1 IA]|uniref:Uncharacterized protein n=1 Tax=Thanatephorus cucumeris (strain AG1-IA) TaxID=983506 RepID=L8WN40_THACA|nr:hypothetical protein AG1IA_07778 [Rhizoctonia solani AG-1 IA]
MYHAYSLAVGVARDRQGSGACWIAIVTLPRLGESREPGERHHNAPACSRPPDLVGLVEESLIEMDGFFYPRNHDWPAAPSPRSLIYWLTSSEVQPVVRACTKPRPQILAILRALWRPQAITTSSQTSPPTTSDENSRST